MIAISDIILLTVSSAVLAVALVRSNGGNSAAQDPAPQTPAASVSQSSSQSTIQPDNSTDASTGSTDSNTDVTATEITPTVVNPIVIEAETEPAAQSGQEYVTYTVQSGDSLSKIATQFGTSVSVLQSINDLSNTRILVGQDLLYPKP